MPAQTAKGLRHNYATTGANDPTDEVSKTRWEDEHQFIGDLEANRPAAGTEGKLFWATDTQTLFYDNGSAWVEIARAEAKVRLAQLSEKAHSSLIGVTADQHHAQLHKASHVSGGGDALLSTDVIEAIVKRIQESAGPTTLTLGAIADGEGLARSGSSIVGRPPQGAASYVIYLSGGTTYALNGRTGVIDFQGAVPETVINSAIAALTSGGTVVLLDYFTITGSINILLSNIRLTAIEGAGVTTAAGAFSAIILGNATTDVFNVTVDHLIVDGGGFAAAGWSGINLWRGGRCNIISNVIRRWQNNSSMGIKIGGSGGLSATDTLIAFNHVTDCGEGLATINSGGTWDRNIWANNTIQFGANSVGRYGIVIQNGGDDNIVIGNTITQMTVLAILVGASDRVIIANNIIKANTGGITAAPTATTGPAVIHLSNPVVGAVISGNLIFSNSGGGVCVYQTQKVTITGNVFYNNGQQANNAWDDIFIQGTNVGNARASDIVITGNVFAADAANKVKYHVEEVGTAANVSNNMVKHNRMTGGATGYVLLLSATSLVGHNLGYLTEATVLSGTFAIDSTGVKTVTIAHGLAVTPAMQDCAVVVTEDTVVDDWAYNLLKVTAVGAANVTVKINVSTASATVGATAKLALRVGKP